LPQKIGGFMPNFGVEVSTMQWKSSMSKFFFKMLEFCIPVGFLSLLRAQGLQIKQCYIYALKIWHNTLEI
jgi:hypothetical protein